MYGLGGQAQVGAYRNAALHQKVHHLSGPAATLELDHVGTGLHEHTRAADGLLLRFLVAAKRQVANQPSGALRTAQAAGHAFGVVGHVFERDAHGAVAALAHHAQRVAHQNALHPCGIGHGGKGCVVGGEHGDFFTAGVHLLNAWQADRLAGGRWRCRRQRAVGSRVGCAGGLFTGRVQGHGGLQKSGLPRVWRKWGEY